MIHLLHEGRALCGLAGIPRDWPDGHRWVSIAQHKEACELADGTRVAANCGSCTTQLTPPLRRREVEAAECTLGRPCPGPPCAHSKPRLRSILLEAVQEVADAMSHPAQGFVDVTLSMPTFDAVVSLIHRQVVERGGLAAELSYDAFHAGACAGFRFLRLELHRAKTVDGPCVAIGAKP